MYILIPLGIISLAGVIFLAVSRKSTFLVRIVALGALAAMIIAVIINLVKIFGAPVAGPVTGYVEAPPPGTPAVQSSNSLGLIAFIVFLIVVFVMVFIFSLREQRKNADKEKSGKAFTDWD